MGRSSAAEAQAGRAGDPSSRVALALVEMKYYHDVMKRYNDRSPKPRFSEPVQVYLRPRERDRLERLTAELETTKSDVLRRGLEALESQLSDPERHPALDVIGIASTADDSVIDVAREHDRYLAATEIASWSKRPRGPGGHGSE